MGAYDASLAAFLVDRGARGGAGRGFGYWILDIRYIYIVYYCKFDLDVSMSNFFIFFT